MNSKLTIIYGQIVRNKIFKYMRNNLILKQEGQTDGTVLGMFKHKGSKDWRNNPAPITPN